MKNEFDFEHWKKLGNKAFKNLPLILEGTALGLQLLQSVLKVGVSLQDTFGKKKSSPAPSLPSRTAGDLTWPCYRHICEGTMHRMANGKFKCDVCGAIASESELIANANGEYDLELGDSYNGVYGYEYVYGDSGEWIKCPYCDDGYLMTRESDNVVLCPKCEHVFDEDEVLEMQDWF